MATEEEPAASPGATGGVKRDRDEDEVDPFADFKGHPAYAKLLSLVADGLLQSSDFDARALDILASKSPEQAVVYLDRYRAAASADHVRNPSAYLSRMMREGQKAERHNRGGQGHVQVYPPAAEVLRTLELEERLPAGALDAAVMEQLAGLTVARQMAAAQSFALKNLAEVRKPSALLSSIIRRYEAGGDLNVPNSYSGMGNGGIPGSYVASGRGGPMMSRGGRSGSGRGMGRGGYGPGGRHMDSPGRGYRQSSAGGYSPGGRRGGSYNRGYNADRSMGGGSQGPIFTPDQAAGLASLSGAISTSNSGPGGGGGVYISAPSVDVLSQNMQVPHQPQQQQQQLQVPLRSTASKKHFGMEQVNWGIRVDEFHGLSTFAPYVHPAAAMKLQTMWDSGNLLLSLLDDRSWELLSELQTAQKGVAAISDTEQVLQTSPQSNDIGFVNSVFVAAIAKQHPQPVALGAMPFGNGNAMGAGPGQAGTHMIDSGPLLGMQLGPGMLLEQSQQGIPPQGLQLVPPGDGPQQFSGGYGQSHGPSGNGGYGSRDGGGRPGRYQGNPQGDGRGGGSGLGAASPALRADIQRTVRDSEGRLQLSWFDEGVVRLLMSLPAATTQQALVDLSTARFDGVRNPGAYMTGVIRRIPT